MDAVSDAGAYRKRASDKDRLGRGAALECRWESGTEE
jgi:hypothetical protein